MEVAFLIGTPSFLLGICPCLQLAFILRLNQLEKVLDIAIPPSKHFHQSEWKEGFFLHCHEVKSNCPFQFLTQKGSVAGEDASWKRLLLEMHADSSLISGIKADWRQWVHHRSSSGSPSKIIILPPNRLGTSMVEIISFDWFRSTWISSLIVFRWVHQFVYPFWLILKEWTLPTWSPDDRIVSGVFHQWDGSCSFLDASN